MIKYPYKTPALRIEQPLGVFYVAVLPAELLLDVAFSDALSATYVPGSQSYTLDGTQRLPQPKRLDPIAEFINRTDAALPNAIILAANYRKEDGLIEEEPDSIDSDEGEEPPPAGGQDRRWDVVETGKDVFELTIPTPSKLAAIIDGQHRLFAFARAMAPRRDMSLLCSIFLDLPKPYQAQLFATINSTQKPVDKSLTFELFGYNIAEEDNAFWSPDKLAVFLARRLGTDPTSPLKGCVVIAPKRDKVLDEISKGAAWRVSTAVVVEGIMRLFTTNPKRDTNYLMLSEGNKRSALRTEGRKDKSPLRDFYLDGNDALIYEAVKNFLAACEKLFWSKAAPGSFIVKTVGIQALFDVLRKRIEAIVVHERDIQVQRFEKLLAPASAIDFSDVSFRNASGSGRSAIRRAIEARLPK